MNSNKYRPFKMRIISIFLIPYISMSFSYASSENKTTDKICLTKSLKELLPKEEEFKIDNVKLLQADMTNGRFYLGEQFSKDSIYIGIANHPNEGYHHYYLIAGNKRYDGQPIFEKSDLKTFSRNQPLFSKGVIFKIDSSEDLVNKTQNVMDQKQNSRNISCLQGACNILNEVEIDIPSLRKKKIISNEEFSRDLLNASVKVGGKDVKVEMMSTSWDEVKHYLKERRNVDEKMFKYTRALVIKNVVLPGVGLVYLYVVFQMKED